MRSILLPLFGLLCVEITVSALSLLEVLRANNDTLSLFTSLFSAQPSLVESLSSLSDISVLAPSNSALAAFVNSSIAPDNPADISALLTYLITNATFHIGDLTNSRAFIPTLLKNETYSNATGGQVVGVQHDTVFPVVTSGELNDSRIRVSDLDFDGGVVHVLDKALTVPTRLSDTLPAVGLTSFHNALRRTTLMDIFENTHDVTILAPSNKAFKNVDTDSMTSTGLKRLLALHLVGSVLYSSDITGNTTFESLGTAEIRIDFVHNELFADGHKVTIPDILVANGVIHVVDEFLGIQQATPTKNLNTPDFKSASTTIKSDSSTRSMTSTSAPASSESLNTSAPLAPQSNGLSPAAGAGIGVGTALGTLIVGLIAFLLYRRRKKVGAKSEDNHTGKAELSSENSRVQSGDFLSGDAVEEDAELMTHKADGMPISIRHELPASALHCEIGDSNTTDR